MLEIMCNVHETKIHMKMQNAIFSLQTEIKFFDVAVYIFRLLIGITLNWSFDTILQKVWWDDGNV